MQIERVKQTEVEGKNGESLLVSTVKYPNGLYETMVLNALTMYEYEELRNSDKVLHQRFHLKMVKKYGKESNKEVKQIPPRYKSFAKDYIEVVRELQQDEEYKTLKDGGASNFDTPMINLKGYREDILCAAILELSTVLGISKEGKGWYNLRIPRNSSQGIHRTYQARFIAHKLAERGYTTTIKYRLD